MRLDIFLPFLRKTPKGQTPAPPRLPLRLARRILPAALFSDSPRQPGLIRRIAKRLGPTWASAPVRRLCQTACLLLFLWSFFYVCWPYTATPAQHWSDWTPVEVDIETGRVVAMTDNEPTGLRQQTGTLHVTDQSDPGGEASYLGEFRISDLDAAQISLQPVSSPSEARLDALALSEGPWTLSQSPPDGQPSHYADDLKAKEQLSAELFLALDPLVSISTAIAARSWVWSLSFAGAILAVCLLIPRGFCGYLCPLGTLIDLFDWLVSQRTKRFRVADNGWWVHLKYYLLVGTLVAALSGILVSGYIAAIPVVTRALLFIVSPIHNGAALGWHRVPDLGAGHFFSIGLFALVLGLGLLKPRFWCRYVCPSGAVFSVANLFRLSERKVESSCIHCNKCVEICPFDAIKPDFTTRVTDCTMCQSCGGVCPTHAIKFVERNNVVELKIAGDRPTGDTALGRRGFLATAVGTASAMVGGGALAAATNVWGARLEGPDSFLPVRPPGSLPEEDFLRLCIRCGECFQACPNNVLQPLSFEQGLEGLWTPHVVADWAGCEPSCNGCTQVCPTGAIRAIPLEEKRVARIGLALVNLETCLPYAGKEACQLCVDECVAAGYDAIEFTQVGTEVDENNNPIEGSGYLAPVVLAEKCVGCGLCQTRCHAINVGDKRPLDSSAIVIKAGPGREDRLVSGSYQQLRTDEAEQSRQENHGLPDDQQYLPDFLD